MVGRTVGITINGKVVFIGLSEGSYEKSFNELFDLSEMDADSIKNMASQGVIHFAEKENIEIGGINNVE